MIIKLLIVPAADIIWLQGMTYNDSDPTQMLKPRVIEAGPNTGDGALGLGTITDPANSAVSSYLMSCDQVDIDTDIAWPPAE
jgi:hypothetical protein